MSVAPRQVLADHVFDHLTELLIDNRLEAGSAINVDALARSMGVSRTPIREALARLEGTGLVRRTALKGYRVAPLFSAEEILELMDARLIVEPVNAFLACSRVTDELVAELDRSVAELASAQRGPSFAEFRDYLGADEQFHLLIAQGAHNRFLLDAYRALGGQAQRFRLFAGHGVTDAPDAIAEHRRILEAFASGDAQKAQDMMVLHLRGVRARALQESVAHA